MCQTQNITSHSLLKEKKTKCVINAYSEINQQQPNSFQEIIIYLDKP